MTRVCMTGRGAFRFRVGGDFSSLGKCACVKDVGVWGGRGGGEVCSSSTIGPLGGMPTVVTPAAKTGVGARAYSDTYPPEGGTNTVLHTKLARIPIGKVPVVYAGTEIGPVAVPTATPFSIFLMAPEAMGAGAGIGVVSAVVTPAASGPALSTSPGPF